MVLACAYPSHIGNIYKEAEELRVKSQSLDYSKELVKSIQSLLEIVTKDNFYP